MLQDDYNDDTRHTYAANIFNNTLDMSSNKYNPNWRNHPNLRWENRNISTQQFKPT